MSSEYYNKNSLNSSKGVPKVLSNHAQTELLYRTDSPKYSVDDNSLSSTDSTGKKMPAVVEGNSVGSVVTGTRGNGRPDGGTRRSQTPLVEEDDFPRVDGFYEGTTELEEGDKATASTMGREIGYALVGIIEETGIVAGLLGKQATKAAKTVRKSVRTAATAATESMTNLNLNEQFTTASQQFDSVSGQMQKQVNTVRVSFSKRTGQDDGGQAVPGLADSKSTLTRKENSRRDKNDMTKGDRIRSREAKYNLQEVEYREKFYGTEIESDGEDHLQDGNRQESTQDKDGSTRDAALLVDALLEDRQKLEERVKLLEKQLTTTPNTQPVKPQTVLAGTNRSSTPPKMNRISQANGWVSPANTRVSLKANRGFQANWISQANRPTEPYQSAPTPPYQQKGTFQPPTRQTVTQRSQNIENPPGALQKPPPGASFEQQLGVARASTVPSAGHPPPPKNARRSQAIAQRTSVGVHKVGVQSVLGRSRGGPQERLKSPPDGGPQDGGAKNTPRLSSPSRNVSPADRFLESSFVDDSTIAASLHLRKKEEHAFLAESIIDIQTERKLRSSTRNILGKDSVAVTNPVYNFNTKTGRPSVTLVTGMKESSSSAPSFGRPSLQEEPGLSPGLGQRAPAPRKSEAQKKQEEIMFLEGSYVDSIVVGRDNSGRGGLGGSRLSRIPEATAGSGEARSSKTIIRPSMRQGEGGTTSGYLNDPSKKSKRKSALGPAIGNLLESIPLIGRKSEKKSEKGRKSIAREADSPRRGRSIADPVVTSSVSTGEVIGKITQTGIVSVANTSRDVKHFSYITRKGKEKTYKLGDTTNVPNTNAGGQKKTQLTTAQQGGYYDNNQLWHDDDLWHKDDLNWNDQHSGDMKWNDQHGEWDIEDEWKGDAYWEGEHEEMWARPILDELEDAPALENKHVRRQPKDNQDSTPGTYKGGDSRENNFVDEKKNTSFADSIRDKNSKNSYCADPFDLLIEGNHLNEAVSDKVSDEETRGKLSHRAIIHDCSARGGGSVSRNDSSSPNSPLNGSKNSRQEDVLDFVAGSLSLNNRSSAVEKMEQTPAVEDKKVEKTLFRSVSSAVDAKKVEKSVSSPIDAKVEKIVLDHTFISTVHHTDVETFSRVDLRRFSEMESFFSSTKLDDYSNEKHLTSEFTSIDSDKKPFQNSQKKSFQRSFTAAPEKLRSSLTLEKRRNSLRRAPPKRRTQAIQFVKEYTGKPIIDEKATNVFVEAIKAGEAMNSGSNRDDGESSSKSASQASDSEKSAGENGIEVAIENVTTEKSPDNLTLSITIEAVEEAKRSPSPLKRGSRVILAESFVSSENGGLLSSSAEEKADEFLSLSKKEPHEPEVEDQPEVEPQDPPEFEEDVRDR